ncbi:MAG: DoxX family protein [Ferruginibacter sp.]
MKRTNLLYWIITGLFGAFMLFTAIPQILVNADAVSFMAALGYPHYFVLFIGIAKLLGVIGILVPGFPRVKEWAYAGLFFDLVGAAYSVTATVGLKADILFILLPIIFLFVSYYLYHKKLKAEQ